MSSSRSITFRRGPFCGWGVSVTGTSVDGEIVRTLVQVTPPAGGGERRQVATVWASFSPGMSGFEVTSRAVAGGSGPDSLEAVLMWIIEATRKSLDLTPYLDAVIRAYWVEVIAVADRTRREWFDRYPDGWVPPVEVVGRAIYDGRTDQLVMV